MKIKQVAVSVFDVYGVKTVSKTDKVKGAYVLNQKQVAVLKKAGIPPSSKRPAESFEIHVMGDKDRDLIRATYYHSKRKGAGRTPEPRLGTDIISDWLNIGDELLLATDGKEVFAVKTNNNNFIDVSEDVVRSSFISSLSDESVLRKAKSAPKKAIKTMTTTEVYIRDPYVIEAAKRRAKGKCEMPGCQYKAFITERGVPYLEGHHVDPLADGGEDILTNVAALCPTCHRELHFAVDRLEKRKILKQALKSRM